MTSYSFAFLNKYHGSTADSGASYIFEGAPDDLGYKAFGSYYLLFNQFIPFELIIILEMVKIHYTGFMEKDIKLINTESGKQIKVQNLSMHEEIGQIEYLFCDKTGTLTKNQLVFKHLEGRNDTKYDEPLKWLLRCIVLCHDVVIVKGKYSGPSQDELVLMEEVSKIHNT